MQIIGEVTILKDNRGICKVGIANKELHADGTVVTKFMRMNIGFTFITAHSVKDTINWWDSTNIYTPYVPIIYNYMQKELK